MVWEDFGHETTCTDIRELKTRITGTMQAPFRSGTFGSMSLFLRYSRTLPMTAALEISKSVVRYQACRERHARNLALSLLLCGLVLSSMGCWAPFRSHGIRANCLPDTFRTPIRTAGKPLNFSNLTIQPPADYILGPNDMGATGVPRS